MDDELREELMGALAGSGVPGCVLAVTTVNETLDVLTYGSASFSPPRPVSERTVFHLFSGTKLYTATALMLLVDRGIVELDEPIQRYLPTVSLKHEITVRQLAAHDSGLADTLRAFLAVHPAGDETPSTGQALVKYRLDKAEQPGGGAAYRNVNYALLGELISQRSEQPYTDFVKQSVLEPLKADADFSYRPDLLERHAVGFMPRWSPARLALPWLIPGGREWITDEATGRLVSLKPFNLDTAAIGGIVGSAPGFLPLVREMLSSEDGLLSSSSKREMLDIDAVALALILVGSAALIWRRRCPLAALTVVFAALGVYYVRNYGSFMSVVAIVAIYSAAAHAENRRRAWLCAGAYSFAIVGVAWFTILDGADGLNTANASSMVTYFVGGMVGGAMVRNRQQLFVDSELRAVLSERDRLGEADRAVARERLRIAREMHDVVAHGMSVMSVQAAAAQEIVRTDPDKAVEVMGRIEDVGRQSLNEMRRMLGVLRNSDGEPSSASLAPQPGLADLPAAVEQSTQAGVATELVVTGALRDLPPGVELTGFRIVQEALTNVLKHAGAAATATVTLDYEKGNVVIDVSDNGRGAVSALSNSGGGNGMVGMRERVNIYGGSLSAGPLTGGGYRVRAVLQRMMPRRWCPHEGGPDSPDGATRQSLRRSGITRPLDDIRLPNPYCRKGQERHIHNFTAQRRKRSTNDDSHQHDPRQIRSADQAAANSVCCHGRALAGRHLDH